MSPTASRIYLDHAATTPLDEQVRLAMQPFLEAQFGNPSSLHYWGRQARKALEAARQSVAHGLGAQAEEIIFTSGATEADNLAIIGVARALESKGRHVVISSIEHAAVDQACRALETMGWEISRLPVDADGFVSPDDLAAALRPDTVLASIIHGNNEIGTLQPLEDLGQGLRHRDVLFHVDAVQTVGKLPFNLADLPVDYLSLSAHKLYGPKGVGALYIKKGAPQPLPLLWGGGQEGDLRSGTENLAGIVGLAKALELSVKAMDAETPRLRDLQERLISGIEQAIPEAVLNGPRDVQMRVPGNVHFSFPPYEGEALVLRLDLKGIAVSSGSACHSAVIEPSRIIRALGKPDAVARSTIRFSMGRTTTVEEIRHLLEVLPEILHKLKK
jgi:cysteine desulfurase